MKEKKTICSFVIAEKDKEALEKVAKLNYRSVGAQVRMIVLEFLGGVK